MNLFNHMLLVFYFFMVLLGPLLVSMAFYTLAESKLLSSFQRSMVPNVIGIFGMLQPFADGLKLLFKEMMFPKNSNKFLFIFGPSFSLFISVLTWSFIPFTNFFIFLDFNLSLLFIFCFTSLGVYGMIFGAWASNSSYAFLGALRSSAQMMSYEISLGIILMSVIFCTNSMNLYDIMTYQSLSNILPYFMFYFNMFKYDGNIWLFIPLFPLFIMFFISMLAETNSAPFDLPEAEAELVAGYNVEYSGMFFAFYFLSEYANMLLMSFLITCLFFGGFDSIFWLFCYFDRYISFFLSNLNLHFYFQPIMILSFLYYPFYFSYFMKILMFCLIIVLISATLPRYSYNQLMELGWKIFLPFSLTFLLFIFSFVYFFNFYFNFKYKLRNKLLFEFESYLILNNINLNFLEFNTMLF